MPPVLVCPEGYVGVEKTTVWGPSMWRLMHCLAWNADPNDTFAFCELLRLVLPCPHCRASYNHYCETTPLKCFLMSKSDMAAWTFFIHDAVNLKLEKPTVSYSSFQKRMKQSEWCISDGEVFSVLFSCMYAALLEHNGATGAAAQLPSVVRRATCDSPLRAARFFPCQVLTVPDMLSDLLASYNAYRTSVGMPALSREDLDSMFLARASENEADESEAKRKRLRAETPSERSRSDAPRPREALAKTIQVTTRATSASARSSHAKTDGSVLVDMRRGAIPGLRSLGSGTHSFQNSSRKRDFTR